ncbi:MAG TPA: DUF6807 family protein [Methylomirabilota bacterium]|nr:DUF6807 family protein [Methylomirabilota bacterium]
MKLSLFGFAWVLVVLVAPGAGASDRFSIGLEGGAVAVTNPSGQVVLRYQYKLPEETKLSVESAGYFHPFATPGGMIVTDVAPADHPHHRGIFLAWVELRGQKDGDFWGWGEPAPKHNRKIVNRGVSHLVGRRDQAGFRVRNDWLAEGVVLLREELAATILLRSNAHVLDLEYTFAAETDVTLARWAFSGFCVRAPKDGQVQAVGPTGAVKLPAPSHLKPESDWPAAPWYAYTLRSENGRAACVAVIDHPRNPPTLWHNHPDLRMLNPCIVAPGPVTVRAGQPLVLRYRVVAADGPTSPEGLNGLAREWRGS